MRTLPPLFMLRHGQTDWNRDGRIQGQMESDLTPKGREQAHAQGAILSRLGLPEGIRAHVSPLRRTRQTAQIAVAPLGLPTVFDARLKEVSLGAWEGGLYTELRQRLAPEMAGQSVFDLCLSSPGESPEALRARCAAFLDSLDAPAIIVSHGVALSMIRGIARGLDHAGMQALDRGQGYVIELTDGIETLHFA